MRLQLRIAAAAIAALLFAATPVAAAQVRLGIGADYVFNDVGAFELTLSIEGRLARYVSVEGRFGGLLATSPTTLGVPLDFGLRVTPGSRVYLEAWSAPGSSSAATPYAGMRRSASGWRRGGSRSAWRSAR